MPAITAVSPELYALLCREADSMGRNLHCSPNEASTYLWGIPAKVSNAFPIVNSCQDCEGTGEGQTSTYCDQCSGAGRVRILGMLADGKVTTLLRDKLPKAFQPRFPAGLVPPAPMCRGLV